MTHTKKKNSETTLKFTEFRISYGKYIIQPNFSYIASYISNLTTNYCFYLNLICCFVTHFKNFHIDDTNIKYLRFLDYSISTVLTLLHDLYYDYATLNIKY